MIVLLPSAYFRRQGPPPWHIAIDRTLEAVASIRNVDRHELTGYDRRRDVSYARHLAMYLAHHDDRVRICELQRAFGNRDHSTIIGAIERIEMELRTRPETAQDVADCRAYLGRIEAAV